MALRNPTRWDVARELHLLHRWPVAAASAVMLLGLLLSRVGPSPFGHWLVALGVLQVLVLVGWWVWDRLLRPLDSKESNARAKHHGNRSDGTASIWDLAQFVSASAMRVRAAVLRPSLAALSWRELRRVSPVAYAVRVTRTGWRLGMFSGVRTVWCAIEEVILSIGGPRMGKSGALATRIIEAPGMVLVTSTRLDILEATREARAERGQIVVFNPTGLGAEPSTMRWSPLAGCTEYPAAQRRADSMIPPRSGEGAYWAQQARQVLAVLLHAAALKGYRLQKVADWIADLSPEVGEEIIETLALAANPRALIADLKQVIGTNERTRTSTTASMRPALSWLANAQCAEIGDAPVDGPGFVDLHDLVTRGQDTIYLIGSPDVKTVTPLLSALTAEVAYQLRMVAATQPAGRLDPPAKMALDEMALTCPEIPIDEWTADMGGRGVNIDMSVQSLAQLRQKWGDDPASSIINNVGTLMIYGGTKDRADLTSLAELVGSRLETLDDDDRRYTAVLDPARIAGLARLECLVIALGIRPVIGNPLMVWQMQIGRGRLRAAWAWIRRHQRGPEARVADVIDLADHLPAAGDE